MTIAAFAHDLRGAANQGEGAMRRFGIFRAAALAAVVFATIGAASAQQADEPEIFSLKEEMPGVGTLLKRNAVVNSRLPFDKRYHELTPSQQNWLKSQYVEMGPNDEPPFPKDGLMPIHRAIRDGGKFGTVVYGDYWLVVDVDATGKPRTVSVYRSPDPGTARLIAGVLLLQKYKPASCDGTPCAMAYQFQMGYTLQN